MKTLRKGYTTGTCAQAAAVMAVKALLGKEEKETISVTLPNGSKMTIRGVCEEVGKDCAVYSVKKDSGDDPDITNGIKIYARVEKSESGINVTGGTGIGVVTKNGLDRPVGEYAINSVPLRMIKTSVKEECEKYGYIKGIKVIISAPEGVDIAKKTFNPRLGIEGGISILGTSGIVEPMSDEAMLKTIYLEMKMIRDKRIVVLTPGNYGEKFCAEIGIKKAVQYSNFLGDSIEMADDMGFENILIVSHMGKLVKAGSGIMNTHSKYGDARMETIALCAALAGVKDFYKILDCVTTDEAYELIKETDTVGILMDRIYKYLKLKTDKNIEAIMFTNKYGIIGTTKDALKIKEYL